MQAPSATRVLDADTATDVDMEAVEDGLTLVVTALARMEDLTGDVVLFLAAAET